MTADAFGTAALRATVLEAWRASPARLREDANTEEDHARGYYRDRVLVELAQNAADAATRAGVPGRLLLRLADTDQGAVLIAANTGAPLDAAGVASLASMRASAKRADPVRVPPPSHLPPPAVVPGVPPDPGPPAPRVVGHFGVGFAAVRAVADEISVLSTSGGVRFSLADTAAILADAGASHPGLAEEVRRRDGSLPALRLPLPAEGRPPTGYDTAVVLQLRDRVAADEVRSLLAAVGDALLLALPGLVEIAVEDDDAEVPLRRIADVGARWRVVRAEGDLDPRVLADRPVEERAARMWQVTWAVPRVADGTDAGGRDAGPLAAWTPAASAPVVLPVVHAPTPTDEPCTLPALLIATFPLDPTRRHVPPGPLTDTMVGHAAATYAELAAQVAADGGDGLALVPTGLAAGTLDGALRDRVVELLAHAPLLPPATGGNLLEPRTAVALAGAVGRRPDAVDALAGWVPSLVVVPSGREAEARTLGVELRDLADLVEELPGTGDPARWRALYAALEPASSDPDVREGLGALPVPLSDGRVVRGARGLVLPAPGAEAARGDPDATDADALGVLGRWGLRVVHPQAAHPLLERLGALSPDAAGMLALPAVRQAVLDQADDDDLDLARDVTDAVLRLVADAVADGGLPAAPEPWLGLLALPAADGEDTPAHGLVLPGSRAAELLDSRVLVPVALDVVDRWGADVLAAVGVRADLVLTAVPGVVADAGGGLTDDDPAALAAQSLDGWEDYVAHLAQRHGVGAYLGTLTAVADLDAVADDSWDRVLAEVAARPDLRRALLDPVRAEGGPGVGPGRSASYTAWWLRTRSGLVPPGPFAVTAASAEVTAVLPGPPASLAGLDAEVQRALGGIGALAELDGPGWSAVLGSLGAVGTPVDPAVAAGLWRALAAAAAGVVPDAPDLPDRLPALVARDLVAVVHADDAAVAAAPMWWQRTDVAAMVPASADAADDVAAWLDLPRADELAAGEVDGSRGTSVPTPDAVLRVLPGAPDTWVEHERLEVDGVPVDWWVDGDGPDAVVHATQLAGLARGLAQAAGRWAARHAAEVVLTEPGRADELAVEAALDDA